MSNTAILLGGGKSTRMQGQVEDKILMMLQGKPLFAYSIEAFSKSEVVDCLIIIYKDHQQKMIIEEWISDNISTPPTIRWALGGARRQDSVLAGLRALTTSETDSVFIHDLARPLIRAESIRELHQTLLTNDAAVLAHPTRDTIKQISPELPKILKDLDRNTLWNMETPQAFKYSLAYEAYEEVERNNLQITDDTAAISLMGHPITIVPSRYPNPKITIPNDIDYLEFLLSKKHHATI